MRANYSTRRTSVVFNPRGGVFGGLRGGYEGEGVTSGDAPGGGDVFEGDSSVTASMAAAAAAAAAADADVIAAQIALEASSKQAYAALAAASTQVKSSLNVAKAVRAVIGFTKAGPVVSIIEAIASIFIDTERAKTDPAYAAYLAEGTRLAAEATALAQGAGADARLLVETTKIQNSLATLTAANKTSIEAAVILLYQTYAKRNPDPAALVYWSNTFGPTITADEVLQFQQVLYANEPNLRPMATATQTTQSSNNLALPIIAAVAGFLLFGS